MPWDIFWTWTIQVFAFLFIISWPCYVVARSVASGVWGGLRDHQEAVTDRERREKAKREGRDDK